MFYNSGQTTVKPLLLEFYSFFLFSFFFFSIDGVSISIPTKINNWIFLILLEMYLFKLLGKIDVSYI